MVPVVGVLVFFGVFFLFFSSLAPPRGGSMGLMQEPPVFGVNDGVLFVDS